MDSYTITIAPNDDSGNSTTLTVDTSGDQVRITDVHLHATGGLAGGTMPTVDFSLLLRAVGTAPSEQPRIVTAPVDVTGRPETATQPVDSAEPAVDDAEEPAPVKAAPPRRAKRTRAAAPSAAPTAEPKSARSRRAAAAKTAAPQKATTRTRRAAAPAKKAVKKVATPAESGGRAYRRMPDDFPAVYQEISSPTAIAARYGVPRHTAQGWIRRIKAQS